MNDPIVTPVATTERQIMRAIRQFFHNEFPTLMNHTNGQSRTPRHSTAREWFAAELRDFLNHHLNRARSGRSVEKFMEDIIREDVQKFFKSWRTYNNKTDADAFRQFVKTVVEDETAKQIRSMMSLDVRVYANMPVAHVASPATPEEDRERNQIEDMFIKYIDPDKVDINDRNKIEMIIRRLCD